MTEGLHEHEEFLDRGDFKRIGQDIDIKGLEDLDGHPLGEVERKAFLEEDKDTYPFISDKEVKPKPYDPNSGEEIIGHTPGGEPIYKSDDPGEMYKTPGEESIKKDKERKKKEFRMSQFNVVQDKKEKMKKNNDNRHLFLIKKGAFIESPKGNTYFAGNIGLDILIIKNENNNFDVIKFFENEKLKVSYYSKGKKEKIIENEKEHIQIKSKGLTHINLSKISNLNSFMDIFK